jgi:hypothetical protein
LVEKIAATSGFRQADIDAGVLTSVPVIVEKVLDIRIGLLKRDSLGAELTTTCTPLRPDMTVT